MQPVLRGRRSLAHDFRLRVALAAALGVVAFNANTLDRGEGGLGFEAEPAAPLPPAPRPSTPPTHSANRPPTISGAPSLAATRGVFYAFAPTAHDADGDVLTLSADVRPGWATFDPATGSLSGTPTEHDVGRSSAVVIRATDGEATVALAFTIQVLRGALGSASLLWAPPTENEDGTPLVDLAGYKLYWGTTENVYPHSVTLMNPGITRYLVEELAPATWHFAITSINRQGIESGYSNLTIQEVL